MKRHNIYTVHKQNTEQLRVSLRDYAIKKKRKTDISRICNKCRNIKVCKILKLDIFVNNCKPCLIMGTYTSKICKLPKDVHETSLLFFFKSLKV